MSPVEHEDGGAGARFPRVSGDEPGQGDEQVPFPMFSPRERG